MPSTRVRDLEDELDGVRCGRGGLATDIAQLERERETATLGELERAADTQAKEAAKSIAELDGTLRTFLAEHFLPAADRTMEAANRAVERDGADR